MIKTVNGGFNFGIQNTSINQTLYSISTPKKDTVFASGSNGNIIRTTTGGIKIYNCL